MKASMSYLGLRIWDLVWSGNKFQLPCSQRLRLYGLTLSGLGIMTREPVWTGPKVLRATSRTWLTAHDHCILRSTLYHIPLKYRSPYYCCVGIRHVHLIWVLNAPPPTPKTSLLSYDDIKVEAPIIDQIHFITHHGTDRGGFGHNWSKS